MPGLDIYYRVTNNVDKDTIIVNRGSRDNTHKSYQSTMRTVGKIPLNPCPHGVELLIETDAAIHMFKTAGCPYSIRYQTSKFYS